MFKLSYKPFVLILPIMSGYDKTFKVKDGVVMKIPTINWCLSIQTMLKYNNNIKLFGLRLKT